MSDDGQSDESRFRHEFYWTLSGIATFIFSAFMCVMMMVPGVPDNNKLWMLSISGLLLLIPILVGAWKFSSTDAPLMSWPFGPLVSVVLLIQLGWCFAGLAAILTHRH
jgi:hypothetical protein